MVEDVPVLTNELVTRVLADDPFYRQLDDRTVERLRQP